MASVVIIDGTTLAPEQVVAISAALNKVMVECMDNNKKPNVRPGSTYHLVNRKRWETALNLYQMLNK